MKKMLLIVAVAFAAISCCGNKGGEQKCAEKQCCKDSAAVCCKADSTKCCADSAKTCCADTTKCCNAAKAE